VKAAWAIYRPDAKWPLKVTNDFPDKDGWTNRRDYSYQTSPNEKRDVGVTTMRANDRWTVVVSDMSQAVGEKRLAQVALIFDRLLPKGYERETFAGKTARKLGEKEIAALSAFIESGRQKRIRTKAVAHRPRRAARIHLLGGHRELVEVVACRYRRVFFRSSRRPIMTSVDLMMATASSPRRSRRARTASAVITAVNR
jgi:hypothetical protein